MRFYTTKDVLLTTRRVELIEKKEFTVAVLDSEDKAFVVYLAALSIESSDEMHLSKTAQIAHLKVDEAPTKMPVEYTDFADIFSPKLGAELPEYMEINDYAIELVNN